MTIVEQLIDLLQHRAALGLEVYGKPVAPLSGENWHQHLLEELLDGSQYLLAEIAEREMFQAAIARLVAATEAEDMAAIRAEVEFLKQFLQH